MEHERRIGPGDRIRTRRNDYDLVTSKGLTVVNGAVWTVTHVEGGGLRATSVDRGQVHLPAGYLEARDDTTKRPYVELGYASTVHSAQGRTVDRALLVVGAGTKPEGLYVGMTRGRHTNLAVSDIEDQDGATMMQAALRAPSDAVSAYEVIAAHERATEAAARKQAEAEEARRRKEVRERAERDRVEREAAAQAKAEAEAARKAAREQAEQQAAAAKADAEKKAALAKAAHEWVQDLPDGLPTDQVAADAEQQWWGPAVRASAVASHYRSEQRKAARRWVQNELAGWEAGWVADSAREKFTVGDDPDGRLEEAYQAAANQRLVEGDGWLAEHGNRPDDDQQEDRRAEAVAQFGIVPEYAEQMVDYYDTLQRAAAVASVEDLTKNRSAAQALPEIVKKWGNTRYYGDALDAYTDLQKRQAQKRQGRDGRGLGF